MAISIIGTGVDNTPNSGANMPFQIQTSFIPELYGSAAIRGGKEAGYGSLVPRDVATEVVVYQPFRFAVDTLIQKVSKFRTTDKPLVEWVKKDLLPPLDATATGSPAAAAAQATYDLALATDHGKMFRIDDKIRYQNANGKYVIAHVVNVTGDTLKLVRPTGGNFAASNDWTAAGGGAVQIIGSARNHELNIMERPRGNVPTTDYTYVENIAHEIAWAGRAASESLLINLYMDTQDDLYNLFRMNRSTNYYYGVKGERSARLPDGTVTDDYVYSTPGLWDTISAHSQISGPMTDAGGNFSAPDFKELVYKMFERYWGAESGGPFVRPVITDAKFASNLGKAFEDKQQFFGMEFVGGIKVSRFEHNNIGVGDFLHDPMLEFRHPIVNGSLKQGAGKAVAMVLPIAECVRRVQFTGGGPRTEEFKKQGGDRVEYMRVESVEGIQLENIQYCGTVVES